MKFNKNRVSKLGTHFYTFIDFLLILFVIVLVIIFILWPILAVIKESLFSEGYFTLDLYKNLFSNNKSLLLNSLFTSLMSTTISTILSILIAIYVTFSSKKLKALFILLLILTMISPPFVASLAYIQLLGKRGILTYHILKLNLNPYGWQGIVSMQSLGFTSLNALLLIGIIRGIDKSLLQASLDLGAKSSYTVMKILIPLMKPGIIVCALLTFVRSLSDFGTPMVIGGSFNVIATEIYLKIIAYSKLPEAAAMNVLILIPAMLLFIPYRFYMQKYILTSKANTKANSQDIDFSLNGAIKIIFTSVSLIFFIIMFLQYLTIFISAFSKYSYGSFVPTLEYLNYIKVNSLKSFVRSIVYSLIAGVMGSFLGVLISFYTDRRKIIGMKVLDFITTLPYIIPGTFFGIGYILAFNNPPLELTGTAIIVLLNCIFKQLPMTSKVGSAVLSQINPEIESAAKDLGANNIYVIKDIIIPNAKPAFLTGFINNFTSTMTTIGSIIFLIYPGQKVATLELFDALSSGNYGVAAMISTFIIIITLFMNLIFSKFILGGSLFKNVSSIE